MGGPDYQQQQPYMPPQGPPPPYSQNQPGPPIGFGGPPPQGSTTVIGGPPSVTVVQPGIVTTQPMMGQQVLIIPGNCPACRVGAMSEHFTCCGICLGICFFPLGMICCFMMRARTCTNCGFSV